MDPFGEIIGELVIFLAILASGPLIVVLGSILIAPFMKGDLYKNFEDLFGRGMEELGDLLKTL